MNVLFLQKRLLYPVDTGWRIRTLNVIRHLARWHSITYLCNVGPDDRPYIAPMEQLGVTLVTEAWHEPARGSLQFWFDIARNLLSPYPYTVDKDFDPALRERARVLLASGHFDLVVCDFVQMARNLVGLPLPASVLFQHNVEAQIFERHAKQGPSPAHRAYMRHQHRKMRRFEGQASRVFDAVIAVSPQDKARMEQEYGLQTVALVDTAVDIDAYRPSREPYDPNRLVFVGSLDWLPNEDAVRYFAEAIWPLIRAARPEAVCEVVGRNPSPTVARTARDAGLQLRPNVADVRPHVTAAAVSVVPLRIGGGTRLKIAESMALGTPVVSTTIGAEGLPVRPGQHVLIEDEPARFARAVVSLMEDGATRAALAAQGRALAVERFSAETIARQFEAICLAAIARRRGGPAIGVVQ